MCSIIFFTICCCCCCSGTEEPVEETKATEKTVVSNQPAKLASAPFENNPQIYDHGYSEIVYGQQTTTVAQSYQPGATLAQSNVYHQKSAPVTKGIFDDYDQPSTAAYPYYQPPIKIVNSRAPAEKTLVKNPIKSSNVHTSYDDNDGQTKGYSFYAAADDDQQPATDSNDDYQVDTSFIVNQSNDYPTSNTVSQSNYYQSSTFNDVHHHHHGHYENSASNYDSYQTATNGISSNHEDHHHGHSHDHYTVPVSTFDYANDPAPAYFNDTPAFTSNDTPTYCSNDTPAYCSSSD